ncbi:MAG TPA: NAD(P)H-dependent oxidoreductase [Stellaceae bacterium]
MEKRRYLVIFAHPRSDSFSAALRHAAVETLAAAGHQVDLLDLYETGFDPALSAEERAAYFETGRNRASIEEHAARLERAQGIVLIYPSWWFGFPAILKGYFDRVWIPGLAFDLGRVSLRGKLRNITRFAVVTSYGSPRWYIRWIIRDPTRRIIRRGLARLCHPRCKTLFLTLYSMDGTSDSRRRRFIADVRRRLAEF